MTRARRRNKVAEHDENRFERENRAFFARVHEASWQSPQREPQRVVKIDARPAIDAVHREILRVVKERLKGRDQGLGVRG